MKDKLHQFEGAVLEKIDSKEKKNTTNQESEKKGKESSSIEVNNGCGIVYKSNIPTLILLAAILLLITITVGVYIYLFREKTELENGNQDTISDVAEERNLDKFIPVIISGYGTYLFDTKNLEIEDIEFDEKMGISGIEFSNSYNDSIRIRQINLGKSNFELYINNLIEKYRKSNTLVESIYDDNDSQNYDSLYNDSDSLDTDTSSAADTAEIVLFLESRGGIKVDNLIFKKYLFIDEQNIFEIEISRLISSEEDVNELRSIYDTRFLLSTDYDKNYFYYSYIGTYLNQAKRYRDSVKFLEDAYDLQKNYTEREDIYRMRILSLYLEGLLSKEVSNTDLAKEVIEYGLEKNPNYPLLHYYKAKLLLLDGDKDGAKLALESFYENSSSVYINQDLPDPSEDKNLKVLLD